MAKPPTPLVRYLRVQQMDDAVIHNILREAYKDAAPALNKIEGSGVGATVRRAQVREAQKAISDGMTRTWQKVGDQVRADRARAAEAAVDALLDEDLVGMLGKAGMTENAIENLSVSMRASATRNVEHAVSRVTTSNMSLSERVYHSRVLTNGQLNRTITSALARGTSASELAKEVRDFIRPDTPGGVQYAAKRLARTELNNAFHATQVNLARDNPMVTAMEWHLSGSHTQPDECNTYASEDHEDLGDGVFSTDNVPAKPHPNCLCYLTPVTPDQAAFIKNFQEGKYDDYLNKEFL